MLVLLKVAAIILPCLLILGLVIWRLYKSGNTKHNKDTVPLKVFKSFSRCLYQPLKRTVLSYRDFLADVGKDKFHFVPSLCSGLFSHSVMSQE